MKCCLNTINESQTRREQIMCFTNITVSCEIGGLKGICHSYNTFFIVDEKTESFNKPTLNHLAYIYT